jgi:hypothetical protein
VEVFIVIDIGDNGALARKAFDTWEKANQYIIENDNFSLAIARQYLTGPAQAVYACHHYDSKKGCYLYRCSSAETNPDYDMCIPLAVE